MHAHLVIIQWVKSACRAQATTTAHFMHQNLCSPVQMAPLVKMVMIHATRVLLVHTSLAWRGETPVNWLLQVHILSGGSV